VQFEGFTTRSWEITLAQTVALNARAFYTYRVALKQGHAGNCVVFIVFDQTVAKASVPGTESSTETGTVTRPGSDQLNVEFRLDYVRGGADAKVRIDDVQFTPQR
jgi:hypothetical protein